MACANIERRPARAILTSVALAIATGILVVPRHFATGLGYRARLQWDVIQRHRFSFSLIEPGPARDDRGFAWRCPAWSLAERCGPNRWSARGNRCRRLTVLGLPAHASLIA